MPSLLEIKFPVGSLACIMLDLPNLAHCLLRYGTQAGGNIYILRPTASRVQLYIISKLQLSIPLHPLYSVMHDKLPKAQRPHCHSLYPAVPLVARPWSGILFPSQKTGAEYSLISQQLA
jgi:hypothetical protein